MSNDTDEALYARALRGRKTMVGCVKVWPTSFVGKDSGCEMMSLVSGSQNHSVTLFRTSVSTSFRSEHSREEYNKTERTEHLTYYFSLWERKIPSSKLRPRGLMNV